MQTFGIPSYSFLHYDMGNMQHNSKDAVKKKILNFSARLASGQHRRERINPALDALGWPRFEEMARARYLAMVGRLLSGRTTPSLAACLARRADVPARETRVTGTGMLNSPALGRTGRSGALRIGRSGMKRECAPESVRLLSLVNIFEYDVSMYLNNLSTLLCLPSLFFSFLHPQTRD